MGDLGTVVGIVIISYLIAQGVKQTKIDNKWLPFICGVVGANLGVVGWCIGIPDFADQDIYTAIATGIASGLAATGANQVYKQLKSGSSTTNTEE